ncbi:hypothetical protein AaE_015438 [Aphanomyces astaci]|uniref:Uncharacterized protein n=1 Tax=Aphanomyces astaci TaxID=112090 RepID=A0A6A4Z263_APHAT|nr:hypothetical protein AaE_015438 [Aphanomyces astaci]
MSATSFWRPRAHTDNKFAYVTFDEPYTLVELKYMDILCQILMKPQWWVKMQDVTILAKWKAESDLSDNDFGFLVRELEFYVNQYMLTTNEQPLPSTNPHPLGIVPLPAHGVFMTDHLVDSDLLRSIQALTAPLEAEARARGDFHPNSNDQVLDIVHPSLYCAVNGRTRITSSSSSLSSAPLAGESVLQWPLSSVFDVSNRFQWLPTPVHVDSCGHASFQSYINNIHPSDHSDLYPQLASLFELMLPMFETCLGSADAQPRHRIAHINMDQVMPTNKSECARQAFFAQRRLDNPNSVTDGDEFDDDVWEFAESFDEANVPLFLPALPTDEFEFETQFPSVKLNNNTLQVIVKIASIELTPHKSTYPGGSWHVEGMIHESIAASGILYYDCDNVTPSKLWFRHAFEPDYEFEYEQDEHTAITAVYGVSREGTDNTQVVGHIEACTGRCVVFPNYMQHRVAPFQLADPTRPGHRKIICFFLINPQHSILSTANVPPQQESWIQRSLDSTFAGTLPEEALDSIRAMAGATTHDQAKDVMTQLMQERKGSDVFAKFLTEEVSLWYVVGPRRSWLHIYPMG